MTIRRRSVFASRSTGKRLALRVGDRVHSALEPERAGVPNGTVTALEGPYRAVVAWDNSDEFSVSAGTLLVLCLTPTEAR